MVDLLIQNAMIVDGTGKPPYAGSVACREGKILLNPEAGPAGEVIDAAGLHLCPGFIDPHSHGDGPVGEACNSLAKLSQGITTHLGGLCGQSSFPLDPARLEEMQADLPEHLERDGVDCFTSFRRYRDYVSRMPLAENIGFFIGHGTMRIVAMGYEDRPPTAEELGRMKAMVAEAMEHGAIGLSSGLIYIPGVYSGIDEMVELCKVVAQYDGVYSTHMRNEADQVLDSIREAIEVGRRSGCRVNISHLKACGVQNHGIAGQMLALIHNARAEGVRVTADQYPYHASSTSLAVCLPPKYFTAGTAGMVETIRDPAMRRVIEAEIRNPDCGYENLYIGCGGFDGMLVVRSPKTPEAVGKTVAQYTKEKGLDEFGGMFDLLIKNEGQVGAVFFDIGEEDILEIIRDPEVMVGTDGAYSHEGDMTHPRSFGAFTRALGLYGREKQALPLEQMIRKMTSLTARTHLVPNKGIIADGMDADLVLFNWDTVRDSADFTDPSRLSAGIESVIVGGRVVYRDGALTGATPGKVVLRKETR